MTKATIHQVLYESDRYQKTVAGGRGKRWFVKGITMGLSPKGMISLGF